MSKVLKDENDDIPSLSMPQMAFESKADVKLDYEGGDEANQVLGMPVAKFDPAKPPTRSASESSGASFADTSEDELFGNVAKNAVKSW